MRNIMLYEMDLLIQISRELEASIERTRVEELLRWLDAGGLNDLRETLDIELLFLQFVEPTELIATKLIRLSILLSRIIVKSLSWRVPVNEVLVLAGRTLYDKVSSVVNLLEVPDAYAVLENWADTQISELGMAISSEIRIALIEGKVTEATKDIVNIHTQLVLESDSKLSQVFAQMRVEPAEYNPYLQLTCLVMFTPEEVSLLRQANTRVLNFYFTRYLT